MDTHKRTVCVKQRHRPGRAPSTVTLACDDDRTVLELADDALTSLNWHELFAPVLMYGSPGPIFLLAGDVRVGDVFSDASIKELIVDVDEIADADVPHVLPPTRRIFSVRIFRDGVAGHEEVKVALDDDPKRLVGELVGAAFKSIKNGDQLEALTIYASDRPTVQIFRVNVLGARLDAPGSFLTVYACDAAPVKKVPITVRVYQDNGPIPFHEVGVTTADGVNYYNTPVIEFATAAARFVTIDRPLKVYEIRASRDPGVTLPFDTPLADRVDGRDGYLSVFVRPTDDTDKLRDDELHDMARCIHGDVFTRVVQALDKILCVHEAGDARSRAPSSYAWHHYVNHPTPYPSLGEREHYWQLMNARNDCFRDTFRVALQDAHSTYTLK